MVKTAELILIAGLIVVLSLSASEASLQKQLASDTVRLHVLANSDSPEDQAMKLIARDAVFERASIICREVTDSGEALELLERHLSELEEAATIALREAGSELPVELRLERAGFPAKEYTGFAYPAGEYMALRVLIGEAQGQNWWCVVFPPLCLAGASESLESYAAGLSEDELELIAGSGQTVQLRFKLVELWNKLWG